METRYPDFNVMREAPEWDDHTREIVEKRLESPASFEFLTADEARLISVVATTLVDDDRPEILEFIVKHFDSRLKTEIGEDQRKPGIPRESAVIRKGLAAIGVTARNGFGGDFPELTPVQRRELLGRVERGEWGGNGPWSGLPQRELFKNLLQNAVEAYYSHPAVWSEIGYAGPAYPRGYVRVELGLADPWEPVSGSTSVSQRSE